MAKLLLITFIFSICFYFNYGIKLIPICKNSTFKYQGIYGMKIDVNSVYKLNYERRFWTFDNYMIDEDFIYRFSFYDNDQVKTLENLRKLYNEKFVKIYTSQYINRLNNGENKEFSEDIDDLKNYKGVVQNFHDNKCKNYCFDFKKENYYKINDTLNFMKSLDYYINQNAFDQDYKNEITKVEELIKLLEKNLEENQILSYRYQYLDHVFKNHAIIEFNKFTLDGSKTFFDPKSSGVINLNIVLPFYDTNYKETDINCLTTDDLPSFYGKYK